MNAVMVLSLLFGLGAIMVLTAQPHGRPRVPLSARLQALNPERDDRPAAPRVRVFRTSFFEEGLRPLIERAGELFASATGHLGLDLSETARKLRLAGDPGGLPLFLGQKIAAGIIGLTFPTAAGFVAPFLPRSAFLSVAIGFAGFFIPDFLLRSKSEARRVDLRAGMARFADLLALGVSAGLGLEAAIEEAARSSRGPFFDDFRTYLREARLNGRSPSIAVAKMGVDLGLSEAEPLAAVLASAESHGVPVMQVLRAHANSLREKRRLELVETGQRAEVRMRVVIGLLILPAFFIVIMYPAAVQLLQVTAR